MERSVHILLNLEIMSVQYLTSTDRQMRKVQGGLKALNNFVDDKHYIFEDRLTLADIAIGSVLGFLTVRVILDWQSQYPKLVAYSERLEQLQSFKDTKPYAQNITDKIV